MAKPNLKTISTLFLVALTIAAVAQDEAVAGKREILNVRNRSNHALKNHSIDSVVSFLTNDVNIAASNGEIYSGKETFRKALHQTFELNPDLYFIRNQEEVQINSANTVAWEQGNWKACRPNTKDWKEYGGNYAAYWVKSDGTWRIKSELFVRLY